MTAIEPGRFTRAAIHCPAGEVEVRLSAAGNWQLCIRGEGMTEWRLACSGDLTVGASALAPSREREPQRFGPLVIDSAARTAFVNDAPIRLSGKAFDLLSALASDPDRVFTRLELLERVWGTDSLCAASTLRSHANKLRTTLRRAGAEGFVVNRHAVGYRLWNPDALPRPSSPNL